MKYSFLFVCRHLPNAKTRYQSVPTVTGDPQTQQHQQNYSVAPLNHNNPNHNSPSSYSYAAYSAPASTQPHPPLPPAATAAEINYRTYSNIISKRLFPKYRIARSRTHFLFKFLIFDFVIAPHIEKLLYRKEQFKG